MPDTNLFSIIIPTFNSQDVLVDCLESICCQTYKNYEVIIVDGKSTDTTLDIVKEYANRIENLKWISEHDNGIYDAMNKGIEMATGWYVLFLGSDDTLYNERTLEQVANTEGINTTDVMYGNVYSKRFNGTYDGEFTYSKISGKNICHQSIFFKKHVFKQIGVFNLKYKSHADWDHNIRWFFSSKVSRKFIDVVITNYADGGYSSINNDLTFEKDRNLKLLFKGIGKLPIRQLMIILKREIKQRLKKRSV